VPTILFLCVANSARSQIAEALSRHLRPGVAAWSAGTVPSHVRPQVYAVLNEEGVDTYGLRSKPLAAVPLDEVTHAVTLCIEQHCPLLPRHIVRHSWPLPDPASAPTDEALEAFRATRDELHRRLPALLDAL